MMAVSSSSFVRNTMIVIPGLSRSLHAVGKHVVSFDDTDGCLFVKVGSVVHQANCPKCKRKSSQVHGRYWRWLSDTPTFGRPVMLAVEMRRFKCINIHCPQQTFSERIDLLAAAGQRRTTRLREAQRWLGYSLGGAAGARLADRLGMHASRHTVLRELRGAGCCEPTPAPSIIGIDDWAMSRGHNYGTIVVDLERRCPIELMDGRDTTAVMPWLRRQTNIEVIARDRASAYADAGHTEAPMAQQVADRWHLMVNLHEAIERLLLRHIRATREAKRQVDATLQLGSGAAESQMSKVQQRVPRLRAWQRLGERRRAARLARYEEAVRRRAQGASIKAIARAMQLDYRTVRRFVRAGSFPERAQRSRGPELSDVQRRYVGSRAAEGCHNARQLWQELRAQGFCGECSAVHEAMARVCTTSSDVNARRVVAAAMPAMRAPSPQRARAWLLGCKDLESKGQTPGPRRQFVEAPCSLEPSIAQARELARRFLGFVHRRDLAGFDSWLPQARSCAVPELRRLVARFDADLPAVRAAFSCPWSNVGDRHHPSFLEGVTFNAQDPRNCRTGCRKST
jgi:transposase